MAGDPEQAIGRRFALESLLGRGSFGEVYRAVDRTRGVPVAVKRLLGHLTEPVVAERFEREARLLARIDSPHVVRYVAHGPDDEGRACLVLEWLDGQDLARRQRTCPLSVTDAVEVARQAALGLHALHDGGIVHRDVKPSNFFLVRAPDGGLHLKLIDLGIARAPAEVALTTEGLRIGTPAYMSPEQARGEEHITPRSDLFSLGVVLYELLAGRRPFLGDDPFAVLAKIVLEDPPRLRALLAEVPRELDALVMRAMAKSPDERFATAREMAQALAALPPLAGTTPRLRQEQPTAQVRSLGGLARIERRVVTAVFAGFAGLPDPETAMAQFARIAGEHGGVAHRMLGRRMIAVFGAERSSGDEAVRAARAALAAADVLPGLRLAVSTGRAIAGAAGLSGEAIDRGAAEIDRFRGGVRVDAPTARLIAAHFVVDGDERELLLRGERTVQGEGAAALFGRRTPTVGRDREIETLEDAFLQAARDRRAVAAVVKGAAGMGKSRVRQEFVRRLGALEPAPAVLLARGDPMLAEVPLGLLSRALRDEAAVEPGSPPDEQRRAVRRWAQGLGLGPQAGLLGELLRVEFDPAADPALAAARDDPSFLRARLRETLVAVLRARAADAGLVLVLEDAHWADAATLEAVGWALDALADAPVLVVAFGRPVLTERFPGLWSAALPVEVAIEPLASRACERLVREVLGPRAVEATVQSIIARAMGNPLFVEELLRAAVGGDETELPLAIQAAFQIRLDALSPAAKRVALVGSVLGTSVWREALAAMEPELDVGAALDALVREEVLAERPRARFGRTREYVYRHALLRDAAYAMVSPDERARLHLAAAEWLAAAGEEDDAVLAHHYELAGEVAQAAARYLSAARRAARESAYELALRHAERGLAAGGSAEVRAALHSLALQACHPLGRYAEGLDHAERALRLTSGPARRLEIVAAQALTLRRTGAGERAHDLLVDTLLATASAEPSPEVLRARVALRIELAWNLTGSGRYDGAIETAEAVLASLPGELLGLDGLVLAAQHALARAHHGAGNLERSLAAYHACVDRATELGHRWRGEGARAGMGQVLLALGRNAEARRELETARDASRKLHLPSTEGYAHHHLGIARARLGDRTGAVADETRALAIGETLNAPWLIAAPRALLGLFALEAGDLAAACMHAEAARAVAGSPRAWQAAAGAVLACAWIEQGRRQDGGVALTRQIASEVAAVRTFDEGDDVAAAVLLRAAAAAGVDGGEVAALRARAQREVRARLDRVRDADLRASMLDGVPENRRILGG